MFGWYLPYSEMGWIPPGATYKDRLMIKMMIQTIIGERSIAPPPMRSGGTTRLTGRSTGSVTASKKRVTPARADPGGEGTYESTTRTRSTNKNRLRMSITYVKAQPPF